MENFKEFISKAEIQFWMAIIAIVISGVVVITRLESKVSAMYDKGTQLREDYQNDVKEIKQTLTDLKTCAERNTLDVAVIKRDLEYIKGKVE